jgi:osmotically inducible lipoprotein OsmB
LLGNAVIGGTGGTVVGAAAGGVAGHELAHNRRKRCR